MAYNYTQLKKLHVWKSPAYVLYPMLCDGSKLPKWHPRSWWGQYMGQSPLHASTVGLILNLQTGNVSPQYHVVHDDCFETIYADGKEPPREWAELVILNSSSFALDKDKQYVPQLNDEWLTPESKPKTRSCATVTEQTARTVRAPRMAWTMHQKSATISWADKWTYSWSTKWRRTKDKDN